jgi:hypothetical protein
MVRTPEVFSLHQAFRSYGEAIKRVPYTARYCGPARRLINNLRPSLASPGVYRESEPLVLSLAPYSYFLNLDSNA